MAKKKGIKNFNKSLMSNDFNYYGLGGDIINTLKDENVLGALGGIAGNIGGKAISGGLSSGVGNNISSIGSGIGTAIGAVNPILGGIVSAGTGIIGGGINALFGSRLNQENINQIEGANKAMNTLNIDSSSNDAIASQWQNQDFGSSFSMSDIGKDGLFSNKAKNKYKSLIRQQNTARNRALTAFDNAINTADMNTDLNAMANYAAYGGYVGPWGITSAIDYELANEDLNIKNKAILNKSKITSLPNSYINTFAEGGGINIKPSKKGTFTAAAKKHGKGVQEFASQVLNNKEDYSPAMVKKANFARNAANWHAFGGELGTNGADFSNGQVIIGNGGTHEENPMEGVPIGLDQEGNPNLVEEGEVVFNDYVFSNRLNADKNLLDAVKLPKSYNKQSFAKIAKKLGEESKERPNDPISKRGLADSMMKLQLAQEVMKQKKNKNNNENTQTPNTFAEGGLPNWTDNSTQGYYNNLLSNMYPAGSQISGPLVKDVYPEMAERFSKFEPSDNTISTPIDSIATTSYDTDDNGTTTGRKGFDSTLLRYAPVVGSAIGVAQGLFSKPDYSSPNAILEAANRIGNYTPIGYTPIGNYLQYKPLDRDYYTNKLNAQAGATRRAIMSTTSPSRNATLLAADYNSQTQLGTLARQAEEYNLAQRQAIEQFNRGTNQANAEMGLKAAMANQSAQMQARQAQLSGIAQAMSMRDNINARRSASMSANLSNFFNSLGDIGRESYSRNMILSNPAMYYSIDSKGNISYKNGYDNLSEAEKKQVRDYANKAKNKKAKGGYLTINKK